MQWDKLKEINSAPKKGQMLIYTRKEVLFDKYEVIEQVKEKVANEEVLEMHLFDNKKEYRCVNTRSKRFPSGVIETIIEGPEKNDTYNEIVKTKEGEMKVINILSYNDLGMLTIENYRLVMGGEANG